MNVTIFVTFFLYPIIYNYICERERGKDETIVYIDIILIVNFLVSFIFLYCIKILLNGKESIKKILLGCIISISLLFCFYLNKFYYDLFKILGGLIIVLITFSCSTVLEKIIRVGLFYSMEFALTGLVRSFNIKNYLLILILLLILVFIFLLRENRKVKIVNSYFYKIILKNKKKTIKLMAYLDSGNFSNYNNVPIIYLNERYKKIFDLNNYKKEELIVNTINQFEKKIIYKIDYLKVENNIYNEVYISFSNNIHFDCILNVLLSL